jgi:hypothetical protein
MKGTIFIIANVPNADVLIKTPGGAVISQGRAHDGDFDVDLSPGTYSVEVTAEKHQPFRSSVSVKMGKMESVRADLVPTTGSILIGPVEPGASVMLDGKELAHVQRTDNQIELQDVALGPHTIRITQPNFADWKGEVDLKAGEKKVVSPGFKRRIVNLTVRSEPGADVYVDDGYRGRVPEPGRLSLELEPGRHTIKAVKDDYNTSAETRDFTAGNAEPLVLALTRKTVSPEFADDFVDPEALNEIWQVNGGNWLVRSKRLLVRGPGLGLIRDKYYRDFILDLDIGFANGKGAVWVVRARDERNYYLFQLSSPNIFRSYISRNGELKLLRAVQFIPGLDLSRPGDQFHITVEARGSTIKHFISIVGAPRKDDPQLFSEISLPDNTLPGGTIGLGTKDGEETLIYSIIVRPIS